MFGELNEVPKPQHQRRIKKRAQRTEFPLKVREAIGERDNWLCVRCKRVASDIHHVNFRSELTPDVSHKRNGCCVCIDCHDDAHQKKEVRQWFRDWKENKLDEEGNYK